MRCYKVTTDIEDDTTESGERTITQYGGTQSDARLIRDAFIKDHNVKKKDVVIEDAEIPLAKGDLLAFINDLLNPAED